VDNFKEVGMGRRNYVWVVTEVDRQYTVNVSAICYTLKTAMRCAKEIAYQEKDGEELKIKHYNIEKLSNEKYRFVDKEMHNWEPEIDYPFPNGYEHYEEETYQSPSIPIECIYSEVSKIKILK